MQANAMTEKVASGLRPEPFLWTAKSLPKLLIHNLKSIRFQNKEDHVSGKTTDSASGLALNPFADSWHFRPTLPTTKVRAATALPGTSCFTRRSFDVRKHRNARPPNTWDTS